MSLGGEANDVTGAKRVAILIGGMIAVIAVAAIPLLLYIAIGHFPGSYAREDGGGSAHREPVLTEDRQPFPEDRLYAKQHGISVDEAVARLDLQDDVGRLYAELQAKEQETFGDLEIKHEPDFHVVAYFTEDGEETIRPYIEGTPLEGIVEVKEVEATIRELEAAQEEAMRITDDLCLRAESDINITKNRAEVYVPNRERFEAKLRRAGVELPEYVAVVEAGLSRPTVPSPGPIPRC